MLSRSGQTFQGPPDDSPARRRRAATAGLTVSVLVAAALATLLGADRARRSMDPRKIAEGALQASLEHGNDAPVVREVLVDLRRSLGRRPLDSGTRVAYAGLLLGLSSSVEQTRAAAFHARRASELAPVRAVRVGPNENSSSGANSNTSAR